MPLVVGWLDALGPSDSTTSPAARVTAAWMSALGGDESLLSAHLAALAELGDYGPLPDGSRSVESAAAMIGGLFGHGDPLETLAAARRAVDLETDTRSPFYAIACTGLGHAGYLLGDLELAITPLRAASRGARAPGVIRVLSLSLQSFVEHERGDLVRARECAELAIDIIETRGLRASTHAALAFAALGQAQAAAGKPDDALATLEMGLAIHRHTTAGGWGLIHHLLVTPRVAAQIGRFAMARELLDELTTRMSRFTSGMSAMQARVDEIQLMLRGAPAAEMFHEPLTGRELDVLRLLQGDLSLHEIAGELYLSVNTVKTHVRAAYRKLAAHSRAEAVLNARRRSLI